MKIHPTFYTRSSYLLTLIIAPLLAVSSAQALTRSYSGSGIGSITDDGGFNASSSSLSVSHFALTPETIKVHIEGLSHPNPDDLDIYLSGPNNSWTQVFLDAGGSIEATDIDITVDPDSANQLPDDGPLVSGTFGHFNGPGDTDYSFTQVSGQTYVFSFSELVSGSSNGTWTLHFLDDTSGNVGSIDSWSLELTVSPSGQVMTAGPAIDGARMHHSATLLNDGRLLVVGGFQNPNETTSISSTQVFNPFSGAWTAADSIPGSRGSHSAVLLTTGEVLIIGGNNGSEALDSCYLFDPLTGDWTETGSLNVARSSAGVMRLSDGTVLLAGGYSANDNLNSAEIYDPATGQWTTTGSLSTAVSEFSLTLLPDGTVLQAGGFVSPGGTSAASIYDPDIEQWTDTQAMPVARGGHSATLLRNGQVLVAGGYDATNASLDSADLYDPSSGQWTATSPLAADRIYHSATLLPDGKVMVVGGFALPGTMRAGVTVYDPNTETWSALDDSFNQSRYKHTASILADGSVLFVGGADISGVLNTVGIYSNFTVSTAVAGSMTGSKEGESGRLLDGSIIYAGGGSFPSPSSSAVLYDPDTALWNATGSMNDPRTSATGATLADGRFLVAGGGIEGFETTGTAEIYDPNTELWSRTGSMNDARLNPSSILLNNGWILVSGGINAAGTSLLSSTELFDPATGQWTLSGSMKTARYQPSLTLLSDGRVLAVGSTLVGEFNTAEIYDPTSGTWSTVSSMNASRGLHTATLLMDGRVLVSGGGSALNSATIFDPNTNQWTNTGSMLEGRIGHTATLLPSGHVLVSGGSKDSQNLAGLIEIFNPATGTWSFVSEALSPSEGGFAYLMDDGKLLSAGGVDRSGDFITGAELIEIRSNAMSAWAPTVSEATLNESTRKLTVTGDNFIDGLGASVTAADNSQTNHPVIHLQNRSTGENYFSSLDAAGFSNTGFSTAPIVPFNGVMRLTIYVNGVPSDPVIIESVVSTESDFDNDGFNDKMEIEDIVLGLDPLVPQPGLLAAINDISEGIGLFDQTAFDENFTAGQNAVTSDPNTFDLYTLSQIQALHVGTPLLQVDQATGLLTLTIGIEHSDDMSTFLPLEMNQDGSDTLINAQGKLEFEFTTSNNPAFFVLTVD